MLLTSMTYREMYDHLAADKYKVDIKNTYGPKRLKHFVKQAVFLRGNFMNIRFRQPTISISFIFMQKPGPVQNIPKSALSVLFMQTNIGLSFNGVQAGISTPRIAKW